MADFTLPPAQTLIAGMTGSGKSTFAYRYLLNAPAACRFVFDDLGRAATRLGIPPVFTWEQCNEALARQWVIFNPHQVYPGNTKQAFRDFCTWVYNWARGGPGKKLFLVDEVWQWQNNLEIPRELALVVQTGREENLEFVSATQLPHKINASITGQSTELVCFRLGEPLALKRVGELGADIAEISALPLGHWVSYNRLTGGKTAGKVF